MIAPLVLVESLAVSDPLVVPILGVGHGLLPPVSPDTREIHPDGRFGGGP